MEAGVRHMGGGTVTGWCKNYLHTTASIWSPDMDTFHLLNGIPEWAINHEGGTGSQSSR